MDSDKGTILRVDLGSGKIEKESLREDLRLNYIGGRGINSRLLFEEVGPEIDPLSPENRLIFGAGPLSGTAAPSIARFTVTTKSPLTGIHGDANAGGHFGPALKKAGIDHIIITGKSDEPVYLWIDDEKVEIKSARHLWGKTTRETEEALKEERGDRKVRIASIGQAGEHLVRFANIVHEERSASRTGVGAVMGSKNLKAIAVRGTGKVTLFDPEGFNRLAKEIHKMMATSEDYKVERDAGQSAGAYFTDKLGILAVKNFQQAGGFEEIENFNPQAVMERYYVGATGCYNCPIHCSKQFEVKEGPYKGEKGDKTEEGAWTPYGPVIGNSYIPAVFKLNNMGNQYGVDHIEFGQGMATVMEWYEKGIVSIEDLDGIEMTWGNHESMVEMMKKVAFREGVGNILAEGIVKAAKRFGREAERYVSHSKGMVMAGIDCRILKGQALCFATSTRGADHLRGLPMIELSMLIPSMKVMEPEEAEAKFGSREVLSHTSYKKGAAAIYYQYESLLMDMLEICRFAIRFCPKAVTFQNLFSLYSFATGVEVDEKYMMTVAERVYNVERAFGVRMGMNRKDDVLVGKWATEPVPNGQHKGERIDPKKWEIMLDEYYQLRGWDKNGTPTREKLKELALEDVATSLEEAGVYSLNK
jgi:aldehyde:ferredoxin oxidoreductase